MPDLTLATALASLPHAPQKCGSSFSPSGEGYHWNWNAESYFLIGKSLGDNMVDLLDP